MYLNASISSTLYMISILQIALQKLSLGACCTEGICAVTSFLKESLLVYVFAQQFQFVVHYNEIIYIYIYII